MNIIKIWNRRKKIKGGQKREEQVQISAEARIIIQSELEELNWNIEVFLKFLSIIGIEKPKKLETFYGEIVVIDKDDNEINFSIEKGMKICVSKNDIKRRIVEEYYEVGTRSYFNKDKVMLEENDITLKQRVIDKTNGKYLIHSIMETYPLSCTIEDVIKKYELMVVIDDRKCKDDKDSKFSRKTLMEKIYEDLLNQNLETDIKDIYKELMQKIGFSKKEIIEANAIIIILNKTQNGETITIGSINIQEGKVIEFIERNENGETFSVSQIGKNTYTSASGDKLYFEGSKNGKQLKQEDTSDAFNKVEETFSDMEQFIIENL